jgi:hypothetical protein
MLACYVPAPKATLTVAATGVIRRSGTIVLFR